MNIWKIACGVYIAICAIIDFLPSYGAPHFRYTGSDPDIQVWNIGYPLAFFIYDPKFGLQIAPIAFPVIGLQVILFCLVAGVHLTIRKGRTPSPTEPRKLGPVD